jgi:hypothetical protein
MTRRAQVLLAASVICLWSVQPVLADPVAPLAPTSAVELIHVPIEILVGSSQGDMNPLFGADVSAGATLRGTLSYDINAADTLSGNARTFDPISGSIALDVGSGLTLPLGRMDVYDTIPNGSPFDSDTVAAFSSTMSFAGFDYIEATLDFQGPPASRTTNALPASTAEIAAFYTNGSFRFLAFQTGKEAPFDDGTQSFIGRLRLAGTTAVTPEPATLLLVLPFAIGLTRGRKS